ncbi:B-cell receptor-associated protein 29 isoform X1 [Paralichthys olivaceus]|uniref:B-cell receptor-associated protein 29 isoform X1 n=1 Tax=Paralichthys olivaceus TaxID=8255 RepID=UPI003751AB64
MTLQWTVVALFLYVEIGVLVILCIPFISARRWQSIFQLRIWGFMARFWNKVFLTMIIILIVLFLDAVREVRKYSSKEHGTDAKLQPNMHDHLHMKLFRAQRNLYISGFAVLLWLVMKRVITLINQLATVSGTTAALQAQADTANRAAKKYMEDNELLKQTLMGGKGDEATSAGMDLLKKELEKLKEELKTARDALKNSQSESEVMKKQTDGLAREYDRLLKEHQELQSSATPLLLCTSTPAPPTYAPVSNPLISHLQYICLPVSFVLCQIVSVFMPYLPALSSLPIACLTSVLPTRLFSGPFSRLLPVGHCLLWTDHLAPDLCSVTWIPLSPTPCWFCLPRTVCLEIDLCFEINPELCLILVCFRVVHLGPRLPLLPPPDNDGDLHQHQCVCVSPVW